MKKEKKYGKEAFDEYYSTLFPEESEAFFASLEKKTLPILRFHPQHEKQVQQLWKEQGYEWQTVSWYPYALLWPMNAQPGTPLPGIEEHLLYAMNVSSLLPVLALDIQPGQKILDACAAPGGKTLFIADIANGTCDITANDTSPSRRQRLQQILTDYTHPEVRISSVKAEIIYKKYADTFDRILADVPCSSEKHVYTSPHHLAQWSYSRIRQLKQRQLAIVSGLFEALKPGGRMVYSTCAITPEENEEVIGKLLKKKGERARLVSLPKEGIPYLDGLPGNDAVEMDLSQVCRILPHRMQVQEECDPMCVTVIERTQ